MVIQPMNKTPVKVELKKIADMVVIIMTFEDGTVKTFTFDTGCNIFNLVEAFKEFGCNVTLDFVST